MVNVDIDASLQSSYDLEEIKAKVEEVKMKAVEEAAKAEAEAEAARQKEEERKHQEAWENAAKEELAKQNSQVVYMFGSKQGITLPQELLDVIGTPESITVKKVKQFHCQVIIMLELPPVYGSLQAGLISWRLKKRLRLEQTLLHLVMVTSC